MTAVQEVWLTVEQAASVAQVNPETIRRWLRTGRLHGARLGARKLGWRIKASDLERLLRDGTRYEGY